MSDSVAERLQHVRSELPEEVTLVAVSKTHGEEKIMAAYDAGQRVFGENKVQEMLDKYESLPKDIEWHLIGHLQTNKVKYIVSFVSLIHAVDKEKLFQEIEKRAGMADRQVDILLQIHIAEESNKFGFDRDELHAFFAGDTFTKRKHTRVRGMMGMATFTDDRIKVKREFEGLKRLFEEVRTAHFTDDSHFDILSMGMSGDYEAAIAAGSNMVRVGSAIFGERNYR